MTDSVYKVNELIGPSEEPWEKASVAAVKRASETVMDLRIAEVTDLARKKNDGKVITYRAKVKVSFKFSDKD